MTKQELRTLCRRKRAAIPPKGKEKLDELIRQRIVQTEVFQNADTVLIYAPIQGEIDLLPLAALCHRLGKQVGLPITDRESKTIAFHAVEAGAVLQNGAYGIPEPPPDAPICRLSDQTLCILPALSFDPAGNRLGYGAGYYDRFLQDFSGVTMGAVYEKLMLPELPAEAHDRPVRILVHERGVIRCAPDRGKRKSAELANALRPKLQRLLIPVRRMLATKSAAGPIKDGTPSAPAEKASPATPRHAAPILVLISFLLLLLSRLIDAQLTRRGSEYISVILLQLLIFVLPSVLYVQLKGESFSRRIRLAKLRPEHLWLCFCTLVVMVCGSLLISILTGGIASLSGNFTLYNTFVARSNGSAWETLYVVLAYALLPAFCEELVYRSILCAEYEFAGTGVAIFTGALFFAMLHFSLPLFPNYLFSGMLLAGIMYATRSALSAMLLHFLYNLFCLFGQPYLSAFYVTAGSGEIFIFCLIVLLLLFAAFGTGEARKVYHLYARANVSSAYTTPVRFSEYPSRILRVLRTPAVLPVLALWLFMAIRDLM